ncbi:hypothetical protein LguiA_016719 [Lonicera macranthoides]
MPNSMNEDQDQRKNTNMEDSTMTIDFLRARLLSERSVSRSARQRADELAKRVVELEEQLKIVSLRRKKAEKATADLLAILKNNGISDVSDEYDSRSDQEGSLCESKLDNNSVEENSPNEKVGRNDSELFSGSELESSRLTGRSLSWKNGKNSSHSLEKKRYTGSSRRRRSSFASTGSSSSQRAGKSCRQIRRRETRSPGHRSALSFSYLSAEKLLCYCTNFSNTFYFVIVRSAVEELEIDTGILALQQGNGVDKCSECFPNCSDSGPDTLREGSEDREDKGLLEGPDSGILDNQRVTGGHYFNGHEGGQEMERALEHQAQLIGQYESEEKAQREWEEKFRENNSCTPDSCDAGNHSDVTEERDEIKASAPPCTTTGTITFENQPNSGAPNFCFSKESKNRNASSMNAYESPVSEFAFSMAKGNHDKALHSSQNLAHVSASMDSKGEASRSTNELVLVPHGTSDKLESVLEALQQAKLSLKQNLNGPPLLEGGSTSKAIQSSVPAVRPGDRLEIPVECGLNGLFRVPTDFQFEATARSNLLGSGFRSSLANDKFLSRPYTDSNSNTYNGDRFLAISSLPCSETRSVGATRTPVFDPGSDTGIPSSGRYPYLEPQLTTSLPPSRFDPGLDPGLPSSGGYPYLDPRMCTTLPSSSRFDPGLDTGILSSGGHSYLDPRLSTTLPSSSRFDRGLDAGILSSGRYLSTSTGIPPSGRYAYIPVSFNTNIMPRIPSDDRLSRTHTSRETGMPPAAQFSFYDHNNPNMYR